MDDRSQLCSQAIKAALRQEWKEAIRINKKILQTNKKDIDTLNRLGFIYLQQGKIRLSKQMFNKVLHTDKYNTIANKNINKLASLKHKDMKNQTISVVSPAIFLEEPGKTKIIHCIHLAPKKILITLLAGMEVYLCKKKPCVEIRNASGIHLGALPDDISFRLNKLIDGGNTYRTIVKKADSKTLVIFIREESRGKKFANHPSFVS